MTRVIADDVDVLFVASSDGPTGAHDAFSALEAALGSSRGRRFYGTLLRGEYRACAAIEPGDDPDVLGLGTWRLPGGVYERRRLLDWQDRVDEIGGLFDEMADESQHDDTRPSIEFYRSARELILLKPLR